MPRSQFVGAWRVASVESVRADGGVSRPWGDNPMGRIIWTADGHFSAQVGPTPSPPDGGAAVTGHAAYFGTFDVDDGEGILVHHVAGANSGNISGDQRRVFRFLTPDRLTLQPPAREVDGVRVTTTLTWERLPAAR